MPNLTRRIDDHPKRQGSNNREIYQSSRWHKYSLQYRKIHRLCVICLSKGITKVSECVDHIKPIESGGSIWDSGNHQALCLACHNRKTKNEQKRK